LNVFTLIPGAKQKRQMTMLAAAAVCSL
jgi:hypothetical protein